MTSGVLGNLTAPMSWSWQPLWAVTSRSKKTGRPDLPPLSVFLEAGVVPRDSRTDNHNQLGEDLKRYLVVKRGDLVFNKLRTWQGGLGVSQHEGIVSPAYFVCRPVNEVNPRFLHYLLRSAPYLAELTRISKWMPPSQFDIAWENLRRLPILLPPQEEQRRIADFLDTETSHTDRIEALQNRVLDKIAEREIAQLDLWIDALLDKHDALPFRRFVWSVDQGSSPQCEAVPAEEGEWGVLKVSCLRPGTFNPNENKKLPVDTQPDLSAEVQRGDLLITRANTPELVGSTAVVTEKADKRLLSDKIFRVRLVEGVLPEYIAAVAQGSRIRSLCSSVSNGASQSMANIRFEEIKKWPIPNVDAPTQRKLSTEIEESRVKISLIRTRIQRQLDLLKEKRQALVTAAVTGQFDVSTASDRGVQLLWHQIIHSSLESSSTESRSRTSPRFTLVMFSSGHSVSW